jgi:DNA-binding response OmpR family regulator
MRVLLVEDERATARLLAKGLQQAYAVDLVDGVVASERSPMPITTSWCSM